MNKYAVGKWGERQWLQLINDRGMVLATLGSLHGDKNDAQSIVDRLNIVDELVAECKATRKRLLDWENENMDTHPSRPFASTVSKLGAVIAKAEGEINE
jgi:hypothetical protein